MPESFVQELGVYSISFTDYRDAMYIYIYIDSFVKMIKENSSSNRVANDQTISKAK